MLGTNPIRPPVTGDGSVLDVVEIFPTIQGEGLYVGQPAVFIRLGGCNLSCTFCDTEFELFQPYSVDAICEAVALHPSIALVVITGGEPLRQPITALCNALIEKGKKVQIETNGTVWRALPDAVDVVCSPKASNGKYHPLRPDMLARANALKFIISATTVPYDSVPDVGQAAYELPIYVQPMDEYDDVKNTENRARALELCMRHGYRLSLQIHKILGVA